MLTMKTLHYIICEIIWVKIVIEMEVNILKKLTEEEKHNQILREVKATMVLIAIVAAWHIGFGFALDGIDILVLGMPLWFFVSTIGAFVISVVGVAILLKTVFINFELGDELDESQEPQQILIAESVNADNQEGGAM